MHAVTSLMRVQQLVIGRLDAILKPHGLSFARYEALVLLTFSSRGSLPLGKMGERLQVHPTSVTSIVRRLEAAGLVERKAHPEDGRAVLAEITDRGRALVEVATADLVDADFALSALSDADLATISTRADPGPQGRRGLLGSRWSPPTTYAASASPCPGPTSSSPAGAPSSRSARSSTWASRRTSPTMGFGYPKDARDGLIESDPETFFLPPTSDLRYQWVCAHLDRLDAGRDARAGHRRLADVHAEDAPRPARAASRRPRPRGPRSTPASGTTSAVCCTPTCTSPTAASTLRGRASRCWSTCAATPHRSRPPRWRSATGSSIGGCARPGSGRASRLGDAVDRQGVRRELLDLLRRVVGRDDRDHLVERTTRELVPAVQSTGGCGR